MPWLLYRMLLVDLLRVIGLTAAVLVTVIAFGATIKPLTNDTLLDAGQTFKYLLLAIVPMLQFALPFSAGFGATLALHRMTADNEIQAMAVSGISYRRILAPVAALGLALLILMVGLTQEIIPRFWTLIERMIAADVTNVFQASIRRGEPFKLGDMQIYADEIIVQHSPEGPGGPETRMLLLKVAAADMDDAGRVITDVTANKAVVDVYRRDGATLLKLAMYDTVAYNSAKGDLNRVGAIIPTRAIVIPGALRDEPKAKSRQQLLALRANPDAFAQVIEARQNLADILRDTEARNQLDADLRGPKRQVELLASAQPAAVGATSAPQSTRRYVVQADRLIDGQFVTRDGGRIRIVHIDGDVGVREFVAESATLTPSPGSAFGVPTFDLTLGRHEVEDLRSGGGVNQREQVSFSGLSVAGVSTDDLLQLPTPQLMARAESIRTGGDGVHNKVLRLQYEIDELQREITSRLLNRYALSVTAPLLLLLGAVLAMWLKRSLPLMIYMLAFLPAVLDLIAISAGEQMMRDGRAMGAVVMWSGNALMLGIILLAYARLAKH